ncbi:centrosomal protein cep57l1-like [Ornithodoros turicata]|uniref:centrosomal protein cep57l1-like n=1 Tax=Ornithodoros turicata TaxID=34597 RepID=UPI003138F7CC
MPSEFHVVNTVGRQCTRSDEVISALGTLLKKMELLEQNRRAAHGFATENLKEHIDLVESQCYLLEEQLGHARKILALSTTLRTSPYLDDVRSRRRSTSVSQASKAASSVAQYSRQRSTSETRSDNTCSTTERYRLKLTDIPFILSKNAGPSHSLPANLQNLVSMLKKSSKVCSHEGLQMRRCDNSSEKQLLDLLLQGQCLLNQIERKHTSRHSLKCKARWLIKHIQDKLVQLDTKQVQHPGQSCSQCKSGSRNSSDGNRVFFRELKRIQKGLEEQL